MSILRSFVAVCCSFYKYCCLVWLFALLFWLLFKKTEKINHEGAPPLHVQSFPQAYCNYSDPKNSIWAPPWLNRGLNGFFSDFILLWLGQIKIPDELFCIQKFIPWYLPIFLLIRCLFKHAVTVAETCINICLATNSKCSSRYSCEFRESIGDSVAERLEFWNCNPEAPSLIHSLTACSICPCLSWVQILIQSTCK